MAEPPAALAPAQDPPHRSLARRLRLGQLLGLVAAVPALAVTLGVIVGIVTLGHQNSVRNNLLLHVEPANAASLRLLAAMVNQETGIRGYELTGETSFLAPYKLGVQQEQEYEQKLRTDDVPGITGSLDIALSKIHTWERLTAMPAIHAGKENLGQVDTNLTSKAQFDAIRTALNVLQTKISAKVKATKAQLNNSAQATEIAFSVIGAALIFAVLSAGLLLRRLVTRPIGEIAGAARRVSRGDLTHSLTRPGPRDLELLSEDIEAMRLRLLSELEISREMQSQLADTATDLQRSNTELEQFAYVASHDLQEPLRKVTSFCQLIENRYHDQLDERGQQYIDFAVDGAKRMQQLINDLLAFSRVGRTNTQPSTMTELAELAESALSDLAEAISDSSATVIIGPLPTLAVEPALIRAVFQNLIANSIKFRAEAPPQVEIEAHQEGDVWAFSCTDNGIGIEAEYAERIFVIFQRLHTREAYPGTGIGLAMCRKIVEHHGGRMWLDANYTGGTRMCFTLPIRPATTTPGSQPQ